ncbi:MAG: DUF429 domain-containing protein, partial [Phycisphaerae bacterium]|nr:DUF429 domain-containing protein [Phycisphaerae bacterium]
MSRDLDGGALDVRLLHNIRELAALNPAPEIVAIDVPIGLTDAGKRECDVAARRCLGRPRGNSVFPAPIRPMLEAQSHAEACRIGRAVDGRGLTVQAWSILAK